MALVATIVARYQWSQNQMSILEEEGVEMESSGTIIAYCGIVCSGCPAYIATQANDSDALQGVVEKWRKEFNAPDMTVEWVVCDGCLGDGRKCGYCASCDIRACGASRGVANCGHCADYGCDKLTKFFDMVPDARTVLERVRAEM